MAGSDITKNVSLTASVFQAWKDGDHVNRGWAQKLKAGSTTTKNMRSTETVTPTVPYLIIDYTPPASIPSDTRLATLGVGS